MSEHNAAIEACEAVVKEWLKNVGFENCTSLPVRIARLKKDLPAEPLNDKPK